MDMRTRMTRLDLEELIQPIVERCRLTINQVLNETKLGAKDIDLVIPIGGPTRMPIVQRLVQEYSEGHLGGGVDPMECVAIGAAIQAGIINGQIRDCLLLDVISSSIGVEASDGTFVRVIPRNTKIPTRRTHMFGTAHDRQQNVIVRIFEGENSVAAKNIFLKELIFGGFTGAPRGTQVEITMDVNSDGLLNVAARERPIQNGSQPSHVSASHAKDIPKSSGPPMRNITSASPSHDGKALAQSPPSLIKYLRRFRKGKSSAPSARVWTCPKCGYQNRQESNHCGRCGSRLDHTLVY
jgi:molecular chaperone DnaK (HSP70)